MTHTFKFIGYNGDKKLYKVTCKETGGSFPTSLWDRGKVLFNKCPCCGKDIEKKKRKKYSKW
jgi:hypothetical protein